MKTKDVNIDDDNNNKNENRNKHKNYDKFNKLIGNPIDFNNNNKDNLNYENEINPFSKKKLKKKRLKSSNNNSDNSNNRINIEITPPKDDHSQSSLSNSTSSNSFYNETIPTTSRDVYQNDSKLSPSINTFYTPKSHHHLKIPYKDNSKRKKDFNNNLDNASYSSYNSTSDTSSFATATNRSQTLNFDNFKSILKSPKVKEKLKKTNYARFLPTATNREYVVSSDESEVLRRKKYFRHRANRRISIGDTLNNQYLDSATQQLVPKVSQISKRIRNFFHNLFITAKYIFSFLLTLTFIGASIFFIVIGVSNMNDCQAVDIIPVYLIVLGVIIFLRLFAFFYVRRLDSEPYFKVIINKIKDYYHDKQFNDKYQINDKLKSFFRFIFCAQYFSKIKKRFKDAKNNGETVNMTSFKDPISVIPQNISTISMNNENSQLPKTNLKATSSYRFDGK
jgi:hypothetical protein